MSATSPPQSPETPHVRLGVVAVIERDGLFLMIQRADGVVAPGVWCFVGGGIEPGESEEQALVRECYEEVGAHVRPQARLWEYLRPDGALRLFWWQVELLGNALRPNPREVADMRWCTLDEMAALELLDSNRQFHALLVRRRGR